MKWSVSMNKLMQLKQKMQNLNIDTFLIMSDANRRYITGFTGSNGIVIINGDNRYLITDSRYAEQAQQQAPEFNVIVYNLSSFDTIKEYLTKSNAKKVGYESKCINDFTLNSVKEKCPNFEFVATCDIVLEIRKVKTEDELTDLKKAVDISDKAIIELSKQLKIGMTEREVAIELEYLMKKFGSEKESFSTIAVSGKRTSLAHGGPTNKKIEGGDMLTLDFGAVYNGYHSDITRTLWFGEPSKRMQQIFDIVATAQEEAIKAIKPNAICKEIDAVHRKVFLDNDVEEYSLRGLGHGIGLEIHEWPRVVMNNDEVITENMIFTVEPGLYFPDFGGVRTEDVVIVRANEVQVITKAPKKIVID